MSLKNGDMVNHVKNDTLDTLDNNSRLRIYSSTIKHYENIQPKLTLNYK